MLFETIETPVDLSGYKTAHGAAKKTYETLRAIAAELGQNPDTEVQFHDIEASRRYRSIGPDVKCYTVSWEAGPYQWASAVTGGESLYWNEGYGATGDPELTGFYESVGWHCEPYYSFDLQFYNE